MAVSATMMKRVKKGPQIRYGLSKEHETARNLYNRKG